MSTPTPADVPAPDRHAAARLRARLTALAEVETEVAAGHPADQALHRFLRKHKEYGSRDRREISEAVFAWFRWRGWVSLLPEGEAGQRLDAAAELSHAAETSPGKPLAELAASFAETHGLPTAPSWRLLFPEALADEPEFTEPIARALQRRPDTWLRLCSSAAPSLVSDLVGAGIPVTKHPRLAAAVSLPPSSKLQELLLRHPGSAEVQNPASQAVAWVCRPKAGERWWDTCCGSGGKTLHLQDLASGKLELLATDVRESILTELNARKGRRRVEVKRMDPSRETLPSLRFDGVLVDAPCSGIGTWARNPDARWRFKKEEVATFAALQTKLLLRASERVKAGGALVYSVCTLTWAETDAVTEAFLKAAPAFKLDPVENPLTGARSEGRLRLSPDLAGGDGMYIVRFKAGPATA